MRKILNTLLVVAFSVLGVANHVAATNDSTTQKSCAGVVAILAVADKTTAELRGETGLPVFVDFDPIDPLGEHDGHFRPGRDNDIFFLNGNMALLENRGITYPVIARAPKRVPLIEYHEGDLIFERLHETLARFRIQQQLGGPRVAGIGIGTEGRTYLLVEFIDAPSIADYISEKDKGGDLLQRLQARMKVLKAYDDFIQTAYDRRQVFVGDAHFNNIKMARTKNGNNRYFVPIDINPIGLSRKNFTEAEKRDMRTTFIKRRQLLNEVLDLSKRINDLPPALVNQIEKLRNWPSVFSLAVDLDAVFKLSMFGERQDFDDYLINQIRKFSSTPPSSNPSSGGRGSQARPRSPNPQVSPQNQNPDT